MFYWKPFDCNSFFCQHITSQGLRTSLVWFDSWRAGVLLVVTCVNLQKKSRPLWPDRAEPVELLSAAHHPVLFMFAFFLCLCVWTRKECIPVWFTHTHTPTHTYVDTNEAPSSYSCCARGIFFLFSVCACVAAVGGHLRCLSIGNRIISPPATVLQQHHYSRHSINNYPAAQTTFSWSLGRFHTGSMFPLPNYNNYDSFIAVIDSLAGFTKSLPPHRVYRAEHGRWRWYLTCIAAFWQFGKLLLPIIWWLDKSGPFLPSVLLMAY